MSNVIGLVTDEGLDYSKQAAANIGWYIVPTGFAIAKTAGSLDTSRTYADMKPTWYSALISSIQVLSYNSIQFTCTIPPDSTLIQTNIGEIYLTAMLNTTNFLLLIAQPDVTITYDPDGSLTFRLIVSIANLDLSSNYVFSYTQATEINEHNTDINAHPSFLEYRKGKVKISADDLLAYLGDKFSETFEIIPYDSSNENETIEIKDGGIVETHLDIPNAPTDGHRLTWSAAQQKMIWRVPTERIITHYVNVYPNDLTWTVIHNLDSYNLLIQCWDTAYNLLSPTGILQDSKDQCTITFAGASVGFAVLIAVPPATEGTQFYGEYVGISWVVPHFLNSEYLLIGVWNNTDSSGEFKIIPNYSDKNDLNQLVVDWGDTSVSGEIIVIDIGALDVGAYKEVINNAAIGTQWNINHDLTSNDIMVLLWDKNDKRMMANYIEKVDTDNLLVDFGDIDVEGSICVISTDIIAPVPDWGTYGNSYIAATSWTVVHNLDSEKIIIQCWGSNNRIVRPYSIIRDSINQVTVDWDGDSVAGRIFVLNIAD